MKKHRVYARGPEEPSPMVSHPADKDWRDDSGAREVGLCACQIVRTIHCVCPSHGNDEHVQLSLSENVNMATERKREVGHLGKRHDVDDDKK